MSLQNSPSVSCPYRGLLPYEEDDAKYFFGRENWCRIIPNNLLASPVTLLYGPSGVGKSSVLMAGVASRLKQEAKEIVASGAAPIRLVMVCRQWQDDPLAKLCERIQSEFRDLIGRPIAGDQGDGKDLCSLLQHCAKELTQVDSTGAVTPGKLLLILDQFEEYFLYHPQEAGAGTFAEEFPRAVNDPSLPLHVLISLREDSLAKLDRFKAQIPSLFSNRLRIDHLDRDSAIDAILKPVQEFNRGLPADSHKASVDPGLVQDVLEQVKEGQINTGGEYHPSTASTPAQEAQTLRVETPFLQLVMTRLWEEECESAYPPRLRRATLTKLKGAEKIVGDHLERVMNQFTEPSKRMAAVIFGKLVTTGLSKIAYPVFELTDPAKVDQREELLNPQELKKLLDQLSGGSQMILRRLPRPLEQPDAAERYEIAHDVLAKPILKWRRNYQRRELQRERSLKQFWMMLTGGIAALLGYSALNLFVKQQGLQVIESAQQLKAQQLDPIDALVRALPAARRVSRFPLLAPKDMTANLRFIHDQAEGFSKAQLLSSAENTKPPVISKLHLSSQQKSDNYVAFLMPDGSFLMRDFEGKDRGALQSSSPGPDGSFQKKAFALSASGNRLVTLSSKSSTKSTSKYWQLQIWQAQDSKNQSYGNLSTDATAFSGDEKKSSSPRWRHRLGLSPDGQLLATASLDDTLRIYRLPSATTAFSGSLPLPKPLISKNFPGLDLVRFLGDGKRLAVHDNKGIHLLVPTTGTLVKEPWLPMPASAPSITSLEFFPGKTPSENRVAVASNDEKVRLYSEQGQLFKDLDKARVRQLRFSPDGRLLAAGSRDGSVTIWDVTDSKEPLESQRMMNQAAIADLQFSLPPKGRLELLTISDAGLLHQWPVQPPASKTKLSALAFNPKTNSLAWAVREKKGVCLIAKEALQAMETPWTNHCSLSLDSSGNFYKLQFSPDGQILAGISRGD
ncbi:MAG: NACHT and WD repeat domain-containing protein [Cyanobium sp.]